MLGCGDTSTDAQPKARASPTTCWHLKFVPTPSADLPASSPVLTLPSEADLLLRSSALQILNPSEAAGTTCVERTYTHKRLVTSKVSHRDFSSTFTTTSSVGLSQPFNWLHFLRCSLFLFVIMAHHSVGSYIRNSNRSCGTGCCSQ